MKKILTKKNLYLAGWIIASILFIYIILPVSVPLTVALISAIILEPAVGFLQNRFSLKRKSSVLIVFISFVVIFGAAGSFLTTRLIAESINIINNAPRYINDITTVWFDIQDRFINAAKELPDEVVLEISRRTDEFLATASNDLLAYLNINNIKVLLTNIPSYLISFLVYLIALFLFLLDLPRLRKSVYRHLHERTAEKVNFISSRLSYVLFGFIKAQFLVSLIIFAVSFMSLSFIVPKTAFFISVVIWAIDFIPVIGSIIILGPWALFHLLAGNLALGIKLAILAAVLLIIRRTVKPKLMGTQIGLSALSTLVTMYLGIKVLGLWGFLIGPMILIIFNTAKEAGLIKANFKI
ncbi:sporulation integral membrane protein YtvI [Mesobacillus zeae]|uniref:Sporulation integral membrane protein YtvI n=1 Tax=Mesobacillus zeae TaxID=1917180 RepID=A0A398BKH4_9BACI|nr:sporulation integral membrane protein YtvI [Mesobacillus zeae]RID87873.1 sporulation integral membrane protein YtvI [Mesobacillus zeae]